MLQRLANLAVAASWVLVAATALVWAGALVVAPRGGYRMWIVRTEPDGSHWIPGCSGSGWLVLSHNYPLPQGRDFPRPLPAHLEPRLTSAFRPVYGVVHARHDIRQPMPDGTTVTHPTNRVTHAHLGLPLLLGAALPATLWTRRRVHRLRAASRARRGLCADCGYDVRATPGLCPECGSVAQAVPFVQPRP